MNRDPLKRPFVVIGAGGVVLIGIGLLILFAERASFTSLPSATVRSGATPTVAVEVATITAAAPDVTSIPISLSTLAPPLSDVLFPTRTVDYPPDWPVSLHFPQKLQLVQAGSGRPLPDSSAINAAMLVSDQPSAASSALLLDFFDQQGWELVDRTELESGGVQLLFRRRAVQAIVTVDISPDDPGHSQILVLVGQ